VPAGARLSRCARVPGRRAATARRQRARRDGDARGCATEAPCDLRRGYVHEEVTGERQYSRIDGGDDEHGTRRRARCSYAPKCYARANAGGVGTHSVITLVVRDRGVPDDAVPGRAARWAASGSAAGGRHALALGAVLRSRGLTPGYGFITAGQVHGRADRPLRPRAGRAHRLRATGAPRVRGASSGHTGPLRGRRAGHRRRGGRGRRRARRERRARGGAARVDRRLGVRAGGARGRLPRGRGGAWSLFQVVAPRRLVCGHRRVAAGLALRRVRESFDACWRLRFADRLALYATGRCAPTWFSRSRVGRAVALVVAPP
jgi:hypothetical protein